MYYGHASWVALVIFGGVFAMRALGSQRRRGTGPRTPVSRSPLVTDERRGQAGSDAGASRDATSASNGTPPGWFADPFFRHDQRFWSGSEWSEHVTDDGVPGTDPPPATGTPDAD
jgi:hypothetical protein